MCAYRLNSSCFCDETVFEALGTTFFSSYAFSFCFSCRILERHKDIRIIVRNQPHNSCAGVSNFLKIISNYLLPLLLTYYCILAYMAVQADNIALDLMGKGADKHVLLYRHVYTQRIKGIILELTINKQYYGFDTN